MYKLLKTARKIEYRKPEFLTLLFSSMISFIFIEEIAEGPQFDQRFSWFFSINLFA